MKMPIILLLVIILSLLFHSYLPITSKSFLYALSLSVKEILLFIIPFIIFFFLLNSIIKLQGNAIKLLALMIIMVCVSNFTSTWFAYSVYHLFNINHTQNNLYLLDDIGKVDALIPSWEFSLPHIMSNDMSIIAALIIGSVISYFIPKIGRKISNYLIGITDFILYKILLPIIPIFIVGFIVKFAHDELLSPIIKHYLFIFLIILSSSVSYIMVWHFIILRFTGTLLLLKSLFPALLTGFSTMSSIIALPLLIMAMESHVKDKKVLHAVVTPITNFHLIGDCFTIPILALTIITTFGNPPIDCHK